MSFSDIAKNAGIDIGKQMGQGAVQYLLENLGITDFFSVGKCDRKRGIYNPNVLGWNNS
jgi:hypothetical protein